MSRSKGFPFESARRVTGHEAKSAHKAIEQKVGKKRKIRGRPPRVLAFSVLPKFEAEIQKHAKAEHRTISEYIREAVRQYMNLREFDSTRRKAGGRMKRKGLKPADAEAVLDDIRKRA